MNIETHQGTSPGNTSLEPIFSTLPCWRSILEAVERGRREFAEALSRLGLLGFGSNTSVVHSEEAVTVHAFTLGIVSLGREDEIQTKAFLTFASHWIDDFLDSPQRVENPERMFAERRDIRRTLSGMGRPGQVGFAMADRVNHPDAVFKSLHRMLYGGLVQRERNPAIRRSLINEYYNIATQWITPELSSEIRSLQPEAYWTTNKTVLELLAAAEPAIDFDHAEFWNLIYAPALYYEDSEQERACGELQFDTHDEPRQAEMLKMIRVGAGKIGKCPRIDLELKQLAFVTRVFPNLPDQVKEEYREILRGGMLANGNRPDASTAYGDDRNRFTPLARTP
jgi:hypothetical protein